eukprot:c12888_g1_i6.p2 GENE.c12888_g1_i6~~c12888_g1_i6.p2  ORF type:complete len:179 (-),score=44.05 c12888_g1_i6:243-779(-)
MQQHMHSSVSPLAHSHVLMSSPMPSPLCVSHLSPPPPPSPLALFNFVLSPPAGVSPNVLIVPMRQSEIRVTCSPHNVISNNIVTTNNKQIDIAELIIDHAIPHNSNYNNSNYNHNHYHNHNHATHSESWWSCHSSRDDNFNDFDDDDVYEQSYGSYRTRPSCHTQSVAHVVSPISSWL